MTPRPGSGKVSLSELDSVAAKVVRVEYDARAAYSRTLCLNPMLGEDAHQTGSN